MIASRIRASAALAMAILWMAVWGWSALAIAFDVKVEPWADKRLPVAEGLRLWLDAGRENFARAALGEAPTRNGGGIAVWHDGSGRRSHLVQRDKAAQPRWISSGSHAALRFDGENDRVERVGLDWPLSGFTVFIAAAPQANAGGFRGFLAVNRMGQRDYESGFTIDETAFSTSQFEAVNIEGQGFGGAVDLMKEALPFGPFHVIETRSRIGAGGVRLFVDGKPRGTRDRQGDRPIAAAEITVGARFYSNDESPHYTQGFLQGDIAEVLIYDRDLSDSEAAQVRDYLTAKHARSAQALAVAEPPAVQMLVPGFTVRQMPLKLKNINNLRYRDDGKLLALGYNGDLHLLSDSDGDGVEDKVDLFWKNDGSILAPIGMALTPRGYGRGQGAFVSSMNRVTLLADTDGDDKADQRIVVAQDWKGYHSGINTHQVDALGTAVAKDGSVFFSVGTPAFANGFLLDKDGRSKFELSSERGCVIKVSPDFKSREIVCTGIRFAVGLAFNRDGDLFATDQEGATWLPNGNPFDELLHIQKGRHYGFPPRHPRHLPNVIDEPSTLDFTPQHQSLCGLIFNDPVAGGATFGPEDWAGDAIATGYSRGKLFRVKLAKTPEGYLAKSQVFACLDKLTIDASVSPRGELAVATHSGGPDWGSGPEGMGTLYKIVYSDRQAPQPTIVYPTSPNEVRIAFDRPLDPAKLYGIVEHSRIRSGPYAAAGDRYESFRPGYAVVAMQQAIAPEVLSVRSVQMTPDQRSLILAIDPQTAAQPRAIELPGLGRPERAAKEDSPQRPTVDLGYDLTGVAAVWTGRDGSSWSGWFPCIDLQAARVLTSRSAEHDRLWALIARPGRLVLKGNLDPHNPLRPETQPGSKIDAALPPEIVHFTLSARSAVSVWSSAGGGTDFGDDAEVLFSVTSNPDLRPWLPVEIAVETGRNGQPPWLSLTYRTDDDPQRIRPWPIPRVFVPWATREPSDSQGSALAFVPELRGGDWERGREVFRNQGLCARCHQVHGEGGKIGPDLSNLGHRDYASVLRDVQQPSYALNPGHVTYVVEFQDGRTLTGVVREDGDRMIIGDAQGQETSFPRSEAATLKASTISTMPEGLTKSLSADQLRDLMTFLLTTKP